MTQLPLETMGIGLIDWSRAQFALTACYHWLFVPLTLGLALIMALMETQYVRTKDEFWKETAQSWQKLFILQKYSFLEYAVPSQKRKLG